MFYRFILTAKLSAISFLMINAQQFRPEDYRRELSIKIPVIDEKRIEKGVKILNAALVEEKAAIGVLDRLSEDENVKPSDKTYKKAISEIINSSEEYREGHMIIYTVFQENCVTFKEKMKKMRHTAAGINKARLYEQKAANAYERSLSIRDLVQEIEKPALIQYKMAEALELEKLSIQYRGRALQIYQDFPVEYNYNWENDLTQAEVQAAFKDPAIARPPDDLFVQSASKEDDSPGTPQEAPIVFRVQIAAHTVKMELSYIRDNIYYGNLPIKEMHLDNWYKYSIGEFDNFNDAEELLKNSNVSKAFVVAYQEGKRLTIKDALAKIKANQQK